MNIQKIIETINSIETENTNNLYKVITFSIFEKWLSRNETWHRLMCYAQALNEDRLEEFSKYEQIYKNAFNDFFLEFENQVLFHFYTDTNVNTLHNVICKIENDDLFEVILKPNKGDFNGYILDNVHEINPLKNIILENCSIYISFGFDLTFSIFYDSMQAKDVLVRIFTKHGFNILK